jgi:hypothetical protein
MTPKYSAQGIVPHLAAGVSPQKVADPASTSWGGMPDEAKAAPSAEYVAALAPAAFPDYSLSAQISWVAALLAVPPSASSRASAGGDDGDGSDTTIEIIDGDISAQPSIHEEYMTSLKKAEACGGFGEAGSGTTTAVARQKSLAAAQLRMVAQRAAADPKYEGKISQHCDSDRLRNKAEKGAASLVGHLSRAIPEPPLDEVGKHSAVSTFERAGCSLTYGDFTLGRIFDKDLSGKVIVDDGIVLKIAGVVHQWFKPDPKSESDLKGAVLALPLGEVSKVDAMLAGGTKTTDIQATLRGISVEGRRFDRMPRMLGTMEELGLRLKAFVDMEKSGFPSYANERNYFFEAGRSGSFSPLKYKIPEYVDWAIS